MEVLLVKIGLVIVTLISGWLYQDEVTDAGSKIINVVFTIENGE